MRSERASDVCVYQDQCNYICVCGNYCIREARKNTASSRVITGEGKGTTSLPQALDELVYPIEAKAVLGGVADVHRHVLRVELVLRGKKVSPNA